MRKKLLPLLLLTLPYLLNTQELLKLRLVGRPEKSTEGIVVRKDSNGRICAAIKVISDMEGFSYDANNEVVGPVDHKPGEDIVYLMPDERVLYVYHSGFERLQIILNEEGMQLKPGEAWVIRVAGDKRVSEVSIGVLVNPPGAEVFIDGKSFGTGETHLVSVGNHKLRLVKPGYQSIEEIINVDEKNTLFRYQIKKIEDIAIFLESEPSNAIVFLDGIKLGVTPLSNFYAPGRYRLRLEKDWYVTHEEDIDLLPPEMRRKIQLQENFGRLTIISSPESGLDIYLNGLPQQNRTPFTFERLAPGSYHINARSGYYETEEVEISLNRGERKTVPLRSNASFATLTVKTKSGATVYMNDKKLDQFENIRLEPSVVVLRAEMAKAPPVEQRVTLRKGDSQVVELLPSVPTGTIQVAVVPFDAKVELRGDGGEYFSAAGTKAFVDIPVGSYKLKVSLSGYIEKQETLLLKEGEKFTRSVTLERPILPQGVNKGNWQSIEFVLVKGGNFEMGDTFGDSRSNENSVHTVMVSDFYLGKTEVTVTHYRAFCNATGRSMPTAPSWGWNDTHPIVNVSWYDAVAFCQFANCRLPTEAEWEYAAREGGKKVRFGNGKNVADPIEINFDGRSTDQTLYSRTGIYRGMTTPVASFTANSLGLYDMSGNVWEWCSDLYNKVSSKTNDNQPKLHTGQLRIVTGGSWNDNSFFCRATYRYWYEQDDRYSNLGFRVARSGQ